MNKTTDMFDKFVKWLTFKKVLAIAYLIIIIVCSLVLASKPTLFFCLFLLVIFLCFWSVNEIFKDWR